MSIRVNLPPGCEGFNMADGTRYSGRAGGYVNVKDEHAQYIDHGDAGLVQAKQRVFVGTRKGRWCSKCKRLWNVWNKSCTKCGQETEVHEG